LENMDREIVGKFKIIVSDKGYDSEENHVIAKRYDLFAIISASKKDVTIYIRVNRKRIKRHY